MKKSLVFYITTLLIILSFSACTGGGAGGGGEPDNTISYTISAAWDSGGSDLVSVGSMAIPEPPSSVVIKERMTPVKQSKKQSDAIIVQYKDTPSAMQVLSQAAHVRGSVEDKRGEVTRILLDAESNMTIDEAVTYYSSQADVEYAEIDHIRYAQGPVNDNYFAYQWNLSQLNLPAVWDIVTGDSTVVVAVVDTGVAHDLLDFVSTSFVAGYDFVNNDTDPYDDNAHGTHVAGTIAQSTNNTIGVAGMAHGVSIMPIKVLGQDGSGYSSDVADGIQWAADNGADIINLSLGSSASSTTEEAAIEYAYNKGVVIVASSGNDGTLGVLYPAAYDSYVLAVGATDYNKQRAPYSNYGPELDVVAPGGDLTADVNGDGYGDGILQQTITGYNESTGVTDYTPDYFFYQGTSMAAPHVAALAALILSDDNTLSPTEIYNSIKSNAEDRGSVGRDNYYGYGIINLTSIFFTWATTKSGTLDKTPGSSNTWEIQVDNGVLDVSLSFPTTTGNLNLYLYDPSDNLVAQSVSVSETESLSYNTDSKPGTYSIEVRFVN